MTSRAGRTDGRHDRLRRVGALIRKEAIQIVRDPSSILIAGILPLVLLFLFGYGVSFDANKLAVGLVLEERTPEIDGFVQSFTSSRYFDVAIGHDRHEFETDLESGRLKGVVIVRQGLVSVASTRGRAPIQVITDGSEPNTARFVENYVRGAWQIWQDQVALNRGTAAANAIDLVPRFWFNPELESRNYLVPGSIAIIMTLIGTLLTALVVAREWERGTMEALLATPVGVVEILAGKLIPYFALGMGSMTLATLLGIFVFGVPFRGSVALLLLVSAVFLIAALALGLWISTVTKNQFQASQMAVISAFLPAFLLSGFVFEIGSMPAIIQGISHLVSARYFIACLQTLFLAGDIPSVIVPNLFALTVIAGALVALVARSTKNRLD